MEISKKYLELDRLKLRFLNYAFINYGKPKHSDDEDSESIDLNLDEACHVNYILRQR